MEAEIAQLAKEEQKDFLDSLGVTEPGLHRLIKEAYRLLGLFTYFTAGEKEVRAWTIRELCTSQELLTEGRAMRHCVSTYVDRCMKSQASIWSMQVETKRGGQRRVLTIEVDANTRRVRQARRKCNDAPNDTEKAIMTRWAVREGLVLPESLRA